MRNNVSPFRREFRLTSDGYAGDSSGYPVPDIKTLHLNLLSSIQPSFLLQGKVGLRGDWVTLKTNQGRYNQNVDVSEYEYIRLELFNVDAPVDVIMFGYEDPIEYDKTEISFSEEVREMFIEQTQILRSIEKLLKNMNNNIKIITEEEEDLYE